MQTMKWQIFSDKRTLKCPDRVINFQDQTFLAVLIQNAVVIKGMVVRLQWEAIVGELLAVRGYQLFTGFVILVIATVFRTGSQLREEQALTI